MFLFWINKVNQDTKETKNLITFFTIISAHPENSICYLTTHFAGRLAHSSSYCANHRLMSIYLSYDYLILNTYIHIYIYTLMCVDLLLCKFWGGKNEKQIFSMKNWPQDNEFRASQNWMYVWFFFRFYRHFSMRLTIEIRRFLM